MAGLWSAATDAAPAACYSVSAAYLEPRIYTAALDADGSMTPPAVYEPCTAGRPFVPFLTLLSPSKISNLLIPKDPE